jgi:hypothetical protein
VVSFTFRPHLPRERPGTYCTGGWVGPRAGLDRCEKSRPTPGFDPRTVQPVASRYTDYATQHPKNEQAGRDRPVRFAAHRQPLYWNFMYHSRIVLSLSGSVWYVVRNRRCTVTTDSVLANSKTQNAFLFPVHAMFRHDCLIAVKPASTPRRLVQKNFERFSTY